MYVNGSTDEGYMYVNGNTDVILRRLNEVHGVKNGRLEAKQRISQQSVKVNIKSLSVDPFLIKVILKT